jgi:uncharacterized protein involved in type VI secretion and phage assembly
MNGNGKYYGKYRGRVLNNIDPLNQGRIEVEVPDVLGSNPSSWAKPCLPITGKQMGMYAVPEVGAGVWVEFEQGNPGHPIWVGGWWGSAMEVPGLSQSAPPGVQNIVIQTGGANSIQLSDDLESGGVFLRSSSGAEIAITSTGITISNGMGATIKLTAGTVNINNGALEVT